MKKPLLRRLFNFPKNCSIDSCVIRETNGIDEEEAELMAEQRGERGSGMKELLRLSIVEVDGVKVTQPLMEFEHWNSKTRALVASAYEQLNDLPKEELAVFLAASQDRTPGLAAVGKSDAEKADEAATA